MRDLILQLSKSSIYSTKPLFAETTAQRNFIYFTDRVGWMPGVSFYPVDRGGRDYAADAFRHYLLNCFCSRDFLPDRALWWLAIQYHQ
ncbi:hypothetical protein FMK65_25100 [Klebsiella variicola]|nr:hypothetical protein [Raoultella planticola]MBL9535784.1 hypothetical protein [Klebsiella pneumoniae]MBZ7177933.1 hypothetical protein [Klebsiella variicola]MCB3712150.1 hypothetical protein [Klebsiella pneumoniae]